MTKELSRFEMAAVKRTAQNVKTMRNKKARLEDKRAFLNAEIDQLDEMINSWEAPIIRLTGGLTSEQVLAQVGEVKDTSSSMTTDNSPMRTPPETDDETLDVGDEEILEVPFEVPSFGV